MNRAPFPTTWENEQIQDLARACEKCGITPPIGDNNILDTMFSALRVLTDTVERLKEIEKGAGR